MRLRAVPLGHPGSGLPAGVCTPGELERASALLDPIRSREFVAGRLALRCLVAELAGTDPRLVVPAYRCPACGPGEHGAPGFALVREAPCAGADTAHDDGARLPLDVAASMSRAGGWALLAAEVTPGGREVGATAARIGIDLAHVADFRRTLPDAAFTADEGRRIWSAQDPEAEAARLWARKEALLKALGTGLRADPAAVSTSGDPRVRDLDPVELGLPEGFVAALART
jgi:4'-phosphopantetheinyl transferase